MKGIIKKVLILIVVVVIIVAGYVMFSKDPEIEGSLTATTAVGVDETISADTQIVLSLLQSISNINLDTSIFERQSYLALEDQNKLIIPDMNPGRDNPFAPIGADMFVSETPDTTLLDGQLNDLNNLQNQNPSLPNDGSTEGGIQNNSSSTIKTNPATTVTRSSAILFGELLTANDGAERFFEYGLSQENLSTSTTKIVQSTPGVFSRLVSSLMPNTTYYFNAVVKVGSVVLKGEIQSFKTLP